MRIIDFSDGFTSSGAPSLSPITGTAETLGLQDGTSGCYIYNGADPTKTVKFDVSGATTLKKTTFAFVHTLDRTITFPNASVTLASLTGTETLTNKTLTSPVITGMTGSSSGGFDFDGGTASNTSRITIPKDTLANITALTRKQGTIIYASDVDKVYKDNGTSLTEIGSGAGGINYISNPDAEGGTIGWATYADAAASSPVDGTGGSPTLTLASSSDTTLRGTKNFLITKDAANRQGEGISYAFSIDSADKAKPLSVSFDYNVSASFVSGDSSDVRVWIYDVTNTTLIPIAPYTIQGGTGNNWTFKGVFQTAYDSTSYRLIIHVATTNASAWTMRIDNVVVGPQSVAYGVPLTDWVAWTPTGSWSSNTTYTGFRRRVGDTEEFKVLVATSGAPTSAALTVNLPVTIDTSKVLLASADGYIAGSGSATDATNSNRPLRIRYNSTTSIAVYAIDASLTYGADATVTQAVPFTFGSGDSVELTFSVPVAGYSSTVLMSSDTDSRLIVMRAGGNPASATSGNPIIFPTPAYDSAGGYNSSTGRYTVPVSGYYRVHGYINSPDAAIAINIDVNASDVVVAGTTDSNGECAYTGTVKVIAGDIIDIRPSGTIDATSASTLHIEKLSGVSAIAATEKIYLQYTGNGGTALTAGTTDTDFTTKVVDSHGAWSGTVFTAPRAGFFIVDFAAKITSSVNTNFALYKGGSLILNKIDATDAKTDHFGGYSIYLLAGETLSLRIQNNATLSNSATGHWISIYSQG